MSAIEDAVAEPWMRSRGDCREGIEAGYPRVARSRRSRAGADAGPGGTLGEPGRSARAAGYRRLDAAETAERIRVEGALGSIYGSQYAVVSPGQARARPGPGGRAPGRHDLRADRGDRHRAGRPAAPAAGARTTAGLVRATTVVLAGEAYLSQLRRYHRPSCRSIRSSS